MYTVIWVVSVVSEVWVHHTERLVLAVGPLWRNTDGVLAEVTEVTLAQLVQRDKAGRCTAAHVSWSIFNTGWSFLGR